MNIDILSEIFKNNDLEGWYKFKESLIPDTLFKYYPLFDEKTIDYNLENEKRLDSLENKKTWFSNYDMINDPYEFRYVILDEEKLRQFNWDDEGIERCNNTIKLFRDSYHLSCFTSRNYNMPMWAHYSNNSQGFCVEYEIEKKGFFSRVNYSTIRQKTAKGISQIHGHKPHSREWIMGMEYFSMFNTFKSADWKYEDEYRVLIHKDICKKYDNLIDNNIFGIKAKRIYVGINCNDKNIDRLRNISENIELLPIKQVRLSETEDYKLDSYEI